MALHCPARGARIGWPHPMKPNPPLETLILTLRQQQVILDADLAALFGVPTKRLNEQVSRNAERFPADFMFQLTAQEWSNLKSQSATSSVEVSEKEADAPTALRSQSATLKGGRGQHRRYMPFDFPRTRIGWLPMKAAAKTPCNILQIVSAA